MRRWTILPVLLALAACDGRDGDLPPEYRRIPVPEARLESPAARARGKLLFDLNCALCHGERGDGRGRRSAGFVRAPADFTDPAWCRRATPRRVFHAIRDGRRGTPMPAWDWLSEDETWDVVAYVLSLGERRRP